MDDAALLRRSIDDGRWREGRLAEVRATTLGVAMYRVVTAPGSSPGIAICHPVALDAVEKIGGGAMATVDTSADVPVVVLEVPAVGALLSCVLVDGYWVARHGTAGDEDCPCEIDITVSCGGINVASAISAYSSSDGSCSGTVVASGDYDGVIPLRLCMPVPDPSPKTYDLKIDPVNVDGFLGHLSKCTQLVVAVENCGTPKAEALTVEPADYSWAGHFFLCGDSSLTTCGTMAHCCPLPSGTYSLYDGLNTTTGSVTNHGGFCDTDAGDGPSPGHSLPSPPLPTTFLLTYVPPDCIAARYADLTNSFPSPATLCDGVGFYFVATPASGYSFVGTGIPIKTILSVSHASFSATLTYQGVLGLPGSPYANWHGTFVSGHCRYNVDVDLLISGLGESECQFTGYLRYSLSNAPLNPGDSIPTDCDPGCSYTVPVDLSCGLGIFHLSQGTTSDNPMCNGTVTISE